MENCKIMNLDEYIEAINTYVEKPLYLPFDENIRALFLK